MGDIDQPRDRGSSEPAAGREAETTDATEEQIEDLGVDEEAAEDIQGGRRRLDQDMDPY